MTPAVIVSPVVTAAAQGTVPQGGAAPGGMFAALFASISDVPAGEPAEPPGMPAGDARLNRPALLPDGMVPPNGLTAEPPTEGKDGEEPKGTTIGPATVSMPAPPAPAIGTITGSAAPPAIPGTPVAADNAALPPTNAAEVETAHQATKEPAAPVSPQSQVTTTPKDGDLNPPAPFPATNRPKGRPLPLPAQASMPPKPARTPTPVTKATLASVVDELPMDADKPPQLQPAIQAKKPALDVTDAKPVASEAKPAQVQTAASGTAGSSILVASATPDAVTQPPSIDTGPPVKTVPLSNLANLPNGAAVTAIGAVIATEAAAGTNRFIIRLDPPELGRIDVRLRFGRDGEVHARLIADRPETASLLMRDAATLERALNASSMRTDSGVDVMLRDSSGGFGRSDGSYGNDAPPAPNYHPAMAAEKSPEMPVWARPALAGRIDLTV